MIMPKGYRNGVRIVRFPGGRIARFHKPGTKAYAKGVAKKKRIGKLLAKRYGIKKKRSKTKSRRNPPQRKSGNSYNGWKNYATWNVALWMNNDEGLYRDARAFMRRHGDDRSPYESYIEQAGLSKKTPDGVAWDAETLDIPALNSMMREL
jgi:hypothetical protein